MSIIRLGTRQSHLARTQSSQVAQSLEALGHSVEIVPIHTQGDVAPASLARLGGVGVFAAALRLALLAKKCDIAVHSFKDLPITPVPGLTIGAVSRRAPYADVLVARDGLTLETLPPGARVGTGSPRRAAALLSRRNDLEIIDIRGNVGTRLGRVRGIDSEGKGDLDAVILAQAGLVRLGSRWANAPELPSLPAPAQGALAVEARENDDEIRAILALLDDLVTRATTYAERGVLEGLHAGCAAPVGALASLDGDVSATATLKLQASIHSLDGTHNLALTREEIFDCTQPITARDDAARTVGLSMAEELIAQGGADITDLRAKKSRGFSSSTDTRWGGATAPDVQRGERPLTGRSIFISRSGTDSLSAALRMAGAQVQAIPLTETVLTGDPRDDLERVIGGEFSWIVFTSVRSLYALNAHISQTPYKEPSPIHSSDEGESSFFDNRIRDLLTHAHVAALGQRTVDELALMGITPDLSVTTNATAEELAQHFPFADSESQSVWLPSSKLARSFLAHALSERGWVTRRCTIYTTETVSTVPGHLHTAWTMGLFDAVAFTAGSNVRAAAQLLGPVAPTTSVVTFGAPSARAAQAVGFTVDAIAPTQNTEGLINALVNALDSPRRKDQS